MQRHFLFGAVIAIGCLAAAALGEQQVKLQSGATLVGEVTMSGANLVVDVDGAKLEVPFKEVTSVTPAANDEAAQAKQLLVKGLESQILSEGKEEQLSLLAEAYRLAPEDPHVAFWYARSLLNAGYGKGASEVFEPKRESIIAAYPGIADRLAGRIEERMALEKLPAALVKRLDAIAAAAENTAADSEYLNYAAYFRLVDQSDQPIEQSAFRLNCSGEDESLESFPDGYYLCTFRRRRSFPNGRCELTMIKSNLASDALTFNGSYHGPENVGVLRVKRLDDADRRPVVVKVVDAAGQPIAGATVNVYKVGRSGGEATDPATTAADGTAKLNLFPHDYSCQVNHENYAWVAQTFVVPADAKQATELNARLHRAITAKIKAVWRSKITMHPGMPQFQDDAVTTGEFEQQIGPGAPAGPAMGRFGPRWVQLGQKDDEVRLEFIDRMGFPQAEAAWVGRWKRDADGSGEQPENPEDYGDVFDMLDLAELNAIKSELQLEVTNIGAMPDRGRPVTLPMEEGDIYLGKISSQDPQSGRPALIEFKILAVEVKRP